MLDAMVQPVSRDQIVKLAEGRLELNERRRTVRSLLAQAARNQVTANLDPYLGEPVPESAYDLALSRAFERACRLHRELAGEAEETDEIGGIELMVPVVAAYSASAPSARRA